MAAVFAFGSLVIAVALPASSPTREGAVFLPPASNVCMDVTLSRDKKHRNFRPKNEFDHSEAPETA